jgi:hypothetical protein
VDLTINILLVVAGGSTGISWPSDSEEKPPLRRSPSCILHALLAAPLQLVFRVNACDKPRFGTNDSSRKIDSTIRVDAFPQKRQHGMIRSSD